MSKSKLYISILIICFIFQSVHSWHSVVVFGATKPNLSKFPKSVTVLNVGELTKVSVKAKPDPNSTTIASIYGKLVGITLIKHYNKYYSLIEGKGYMSSKAIRGYVPRKYLLTVTANKSYGIYVNKTTQTLTVYKNGAFYSQMACSTGMAGSETPTGTFLTGAKCPDVIGYGQYAQYGIRFDKQVYIHGIPKENGSYSKAKKLLGKKASHGCVRVPVENARWLYKTIPANTCIIVS